MINGKRIFVILSEQQLETYMEDIDELKYAHVSYRETTYIIKQDEINYIEVIADGNE